MCHWCTDHGRGQVWYENFENYLFNKILPTSEEQEEAKRKMVATFEPKVIAFCCHYCAYSAADLAGSMRLEYSPNVRIVKLMCTGKIDTIHLLKAFEQGADAVFVAG